MKKPDGRLWAEQAALWLYPRRCPFCNVILGRDALAGAVCPACAAEEQRLAHEPPRVPETEHVLYALNGALAAYYYEGMVREAILLCKRGGHPWYARELADRMAVRIWGAVPASRPGLRQQDVLFENLPAYQCIVPVPPHQPTPGTPGLPLLLARRLGILFQIPVCQSLCVTRESAAQKSLSRVERLRNAKKAYRCKTGADLSGKRVLLVDDIITTGATISSCALALLEAGAVEVTAAAIAVDEDMPKEKQKPTEKDR